MNVDTTRVDVDASAVASVIDRFVREWLLDDEFCGQDPLAEKEIDSLALEQLLAYLEERYRVLFDAEDTARMNLSSVPAAAHMVVRRLVATRSGTQEESELRRQAEMAAREWAADACPFDRSQPQPATQEIFDDEAATDAVLVAIPGSADRLGIPAVDFFEGMGDLQARRIYIRHLMLAIGRPHQLGQSVAEVTDSVLAMTTRNRRRVFFGTSLGGFHALLLGTLVRADAVVCVNPITSMLRQVLDRAGDDRWDDILAQAPASWLAEFGDLPTLWAREPAPRVIVHYPYRNRIYATQAEHLAERANVQLVPHYEHSPMHKTVENGELRSQLLRLLAPRD